MITTHSYADTDVMIVLGNAPDPLLAKRIAHILVEEHLAACVNLGGASLSIYMWQDVLEGTEEVSVTMKTNGAKLKALIQRYIELHPYDVPEVLIMPVLGGTTAYINWVIEQTSKE